MSVYEWFCESNEQMRRGKPVPVDGVEGKKETKGTPTRAIFAGKRTRRREGGW